ncbi:hypothetical protein HF290_07580 [Acidithiobacillus ferrooxidans]|uniref:hypothetical protein n=1 Tax=Acidithiobacillus ferrooxidans TaxID=920 RepID=UPI001C079BF5|nr:hypothetical protein [Acidithiobacillus ferrooxidans]MBU2860266.1 hypothetical protein [Acidithiobacillus ferrooxidans]
MSAVSDHTELLQTWLLPGVTVLLAIATAALACFTYKMAKSTEKALEQNARLVEETHDLVESNKVLVESEERHHQENLRPLVFIDPTDLMAGEVCEHLFGEVTPISTANDGFILPLNGLVVNRGLGPAFNVRVVYRKHPEPYDFETIIPPIAANTGWTYGPVGTTIIPLVIRLKTDISSIKSTLSVPRHFKWVA